MSTKINKKSLNNR